MERRLWRKTSQHAYITEIVRGRQLLNAVCTDSFQYLHDAKDHTTPSCYGECGYLAKTNHQPPFDSWISPPCINIIFP